MTPSQIIEAAQIEAQRTLAEAEAVVIRDIDRGTAIPAWQHMTPDERSRMTRAELLWAFGPRHDDRYNDAIPRAIRAMIRRLIVFED